MYYECDRNMLQMGFIHTNHRGRTRSLKPIYISVVYNLFLRLHELQKPKTGKYAHNKLYKVDH